jgi:ATP-dependent helicase HrpB
LTRQNSSAEDLPDLPVRACLSALQSALASGHAILTAEPGSGKTTLVPLLLRDRSWLHGRKIVMLEPRRPAARMAARRMASLIGDKVGGEVGFQVRFERQIGAETRIEVVTEGLLLRRLQADPELSDVGLVIFDEFHERNLQGDLSLALCLDVADGLREDLRLLVMSASIDAAPLAALMRAQVIDAPGRCHPVAIVHADKDPEPRQVLVACERELARAMEECVGDVLVFLPGRGEIERFRVTVETRWGGRCEVRPLYGDLAAKEQDAVLCARGGRRRIILATDIAETSLTIEGVEAVVDSGLARRPGFDPNSGLTRLETRRISQASALQRAGRAGRLGPGKCFRVWSEARHARLQPWSPPEVVEADLAPVVLELANWGVTDPATMRWLDDPPAAHWAQARELLQVLAALDAQGRITAAGRQMARLPTHPRLAHMLVTADGEAARRIAADIAALLSERDPVSRGGSSAGIGIDIEVRLQALNRMRAGSEPPSGFDRQALRRVDRAAAQLHRLSDAALPVSGADSAAALVAMAYPDRVAQATGGDGRRYLMRNGRAVLLDDDDPLRGTAWLAIASLDAGRRDGRVWLAAALQRDELEAVFGGDIESRRELRWDEGVNDVVARRVRRLGALTLDELAVSLDPEDDVSGVILARIRADGLAAWFDDAADLRARVELMRGLEPEAGWPDFSERGLLDDPESWLQPWLAPGQGARALRRHGLEEMLASALGWNLRQRLDAALPTHYQTPAGSSRRIDYAAEGGPVLAVPLQEMLGMQTGPALASGRIVPVLHLLSPAGRPLQVTRDLGGFWRGAYSEVKKEMRGRYPKHFWPDDPLTASATRHTKRRM